MKEVKRVLHHIGIVTVMLGWGHLFFGGVLASPIDLDWLGAHTGEVITHLSHRYRTSLEKDMEGRFLTVYGEEFPLSGRDDVRLFTREIREEARFSTREALRVTTQDIVDDIELVTMVKEYTRGLTRAVLDVGKEEIKFQGPSLTQREERGEVPGKISYVRSVLVLTNDFPFMTAPLGVTMETTFPRLPGLETRMTYYLSGQEVMGFQVGRTLTPWSALYIGYRVSEDNSDLFASLQIHSK